jgi:ribosomal protein S13
MDIQLDQIQNMIYVIRGQKVMLDSNLARLYGVETKRLNEQVPRNQNRFPDDFMFQLSEEEFDSLRSQIANSKEGKGGRRYQPLVFTENGVAMLSTVLNSEVAIEVNISIMRIFTKFRSFHALEERVDRKVDSLKENVSQVFKVVFQRLDDLESVPEVQKKRKKIGLKDEI